MELSVALIEAQRQAAGQKDEVLVLPAAAGGGGGSGADSNAHSSAASSPNGIPISLEK